VLAGVAAIVVAAAIVTGIVLGGNAGAPEAVHSPAATEDPVLVAGVPTPGFVSAAADGAALTFTVSNPSPEGGDVIVWRISNRTQSEALHKAEGLSFTIPDYAPGSTVCVEVSILRSGKLSVDPLEECYPQ
jgi:hypothetical protein